MSPLPYGRHEVDDADRETVEQVLRSDWLTTGPTVDAFEDALASRCGATHAVAVSSGTAALHAAVHALGIGPGDEVIVPAITFVATANCVVYEGGTPVFADVDPCTLLIDPDAVAAAVTPRTRAIIAVDYAGQPAEYDRLRAVAARHGLAIVADACHALGASFGDEPVGAVADLSVFSFHPVKHITTGEGGAITTDDPDFMHRMRSFRNHGITTDHRERSRAGTWRYEMKRLGYNYRLSDIHAALGLSQLRKLDSWIDKRRLIADWYRDALDGRPYVSALEELPGRSHVYHLFVVKVQGGRDRVFEELRHRRIGANVHYAPVHLHPFYRERFGTRPGQCPIAEAVGAHVLTLPLFPGMNRSDVDRVVGALDEIAAMPGVEPGRGGLSDER